MTRPPSEYSKPSHRREVLAAELREIIQEQLQRGLSDPRITGLITITSVEVDQDLARAEIRVSVMPEKNQAKVIGGLRHSAKHLRHKVGEKITTIRIPDLVFELDTSLKKQAAVIEALAKVAAERETREPRQPEKTEEGIDSHGQRGNNPNTGRAGGAPGEPFSA